MRRQILTLLVLLIIVSPQMLSGQDPSSRGLARVVSQDSKPGSGAVLDRLITLDLRAAPLAQALDDIARAAGIRLAYNHELLPAGARVTLSGRRPANSAFRRVLSGTGLQITGPTSSGHFIIARTPAGPPPVVPEAGAINGRVVERSSGRPLPDVSVALDGTAFSTITDDDGRFRFASVPAGTYTMRVSSVGYSTGERAVTVRDGAQTTADFALETHAISLDDLVVTGTVTATPIRAVPTPITVIRSADIERQNIQSVDELFRLMIPGGVQTVQSPGPGGYAEFGVRGTASLSVFSVVKILIDGIEVENGAYIKAIDPASVERVEFISGPQASAVYGSGAIGGVMQIFTKKGVPGDARPVVTGSVALGTIDGRYVDDTPVTQEYRVAVNGGTGTMGYSVGGSWEQESPSIPDGAERGGSLFSGVRLGIGKVTANLMLRYRGDFDHEGRNPREAIIFMDETTAPSTRRMDWHSYMYGADVKYAQSERWSHQLAIGFDGGSTEQYTTEPRRATPADTFSTLIVYNRRKNSVRYNTSYNIPFNTSALTITGGGDYASHSLVGLTGYALPGSYGPTGTYPELSGSRSVQRLAGLFAQGLLDITDRVFITAGLHGDMSEGEASTVWSPRVGAAVSQSLGAAEVKLRAAYGSALIAPDPANKQGAVSPGFTILANPALLPERQAGYDAGVEVHWANRASVAVTYYNQLARDLVSLTFLSFDPEEGSSFQWQNIGRIRNQGWELTTKLVPTANLELSGVLGTTKSTVEELSDAYGGALEVGDTPQRVPDWTGGAMLAWTPFSGTTLTANITHRASWVETNYQERFGALLGGTFTGNPKDYWQDYEPLTKFGLGVEQALSESLRGFFRVENAGNNYNFEGHDLLPPRGREVDVGLRFRFN